MHQWIKRITCTHYKPVDTLQAAESQVGNVSLIFVPVLVWGVDVCDSSSSDQRDAFVTRTLGHKQHGGLLWFDVPRPKKHQGENMCTTDKTCLRIPAVKKSAFRPEGDGVLLRVDNVSVFTSLAVLLLCVHLGVLGIRWAFRVGIVPATHQMKTPCSTTGSLDKRAVQKTPSTGSDRKHAVRSTFYFNDKVILTPKCIFIQIHYPEFTN